MSSLEMYKMLNEGRAAILDPDEKIIDYDIYGNLLTGTIRQVEEMQRVAKLKKMQEELENIQLFKKTLDSCKCESIVERRLGLKI